MGTATSARPSLATDPGRGRTTRVRAGAPSQGDPYLAFMTMQSMCPSLAAGFLTGQAPGVRFCCANSEGCPPGPGPVQEMGKPFLRLRNQFSRQARRLRRATAAGLAPVGEALHAAAMLEALDHVIVAVQELGPATTTLARLLGRAPTWRGEHPGLGTRNSLFRLSNTYLELLAPAGPADHGAWLRQRLETEGEGLLGLAFRTPDAEACCRELRARGLDAGPPADGLGRDEESGAYRRWRSVLLPAAQTRGILLFAIEHRSPDESLAPAPPLGEAAGCVSGLDHVVVVSADVEAARRLYGEQLGLRLALDRSFEERRLRLLFFRIGGTTVELAHPLGAPAAATDRFMGLSFQVPDVGAARERVAAAGFDVSPVRPGMKPGTRVCTVRGRPLGVDTLLIQPAPRPEAAVR